ncbi:AAC(3) family N-acetyltransferase [Natrononativus amylolyticus]|uniref:AAC(3) family N-acetyltransferase n=1 Tax=Natrononativus amylolyticus TaxID=2963434 RepID=UPI0020CFB082|nr:AAC(3) family N-acetyltransferase [Natrononativus amylolyticus]
MTGTPDPADGTVSTADLVADLERLGLRDGDEVAVHGALSSIGWVEGGANAVIDALCTAVGSEGTVVVPTFTPFVVREEPFDRERTRSRTGAITETLRTRPDAVRSAHPTHSVSAIGPAATTLTTDHALERSLGADSPLHRLARRGGSILLVGVGHERNSTIHVAEALAELPYKTGTNRVLVRDGDGTVRTVETARVGCGKGFSALEPLADDAGVLRRGHIGRAPAQLMDGDAIIEAALEALEDDPGFLLCAEPDCWWCPEARERIE